ncbi:MAG: uroporphyrinogen decarboxylase [Pirellulales bacterium]
MSHSTEPPSKLRIASFESRRASDMTQLILRAGGVPCVSPSMREISLDSDRNLVDFANHLMTGQIDVAIFLTGVGTRLLMECIERHVPNERFRDSLRDIPTIARGPKPLKVLREMGIHPTFCAPEPNTWREILSVLDTHLPIANRTVAVQEYGIPNTSLIAGLEARGASVESIKVYRWGLPLQTDALQENIRRIVRGEIDVVLFTAAQQVVHLMKMAQELDLHSNLLRGLQQTVVASIGPTTSEMLRFHDIAVDFVPSHPKMGHLVHESTQQAQLLQAKKKKMSTRVKPTGPKNEGPKNESTIQHPSYHSPFMQACRREPVPYTPVWLMRQAGRYMAEYRAVRAETTFLQLCKNPQLCSEVMCTAVDRLGVDAAIIFSDLLPILEPMGIELEFTPGDGPKIHNPIRAAEDVNRVLELEDTEPLHFVFETVAATRRDLPESIPLIGFAGAPFTLASYAIEGGASRNFLHTKTLMYRDPTAWHELMQRLSRSIIRYLNAQIAAGAQAVQLFDSWVGCLGTEDYRTFVMPYIKQIVRGLAAEAPLIHFAAGNPALLPLLSEAGGDVIGIDWRIGLAEAWEAVGHHKGVQGNLDPAILLADRKVLAQRTAEVLTQAAGRSGHIFNLGHGVHQQTPVDNVRALVDEVHELSSR